MRLTLKLSTVSYVGEMSFRMFSAEGRKELGIVSTMLIDKVWELAQTSFVDPQTSPPTSLRGNQLSVPAEATGSCQCPSH